MSEEKEHLEKRIELLEQLQARLRAAHKDLEAIDIEERRKRFGGG